MVNYLCCHCWLIKQQEQVTESAHFGEAAERAVLFLLENLQLYEIFMNETHFMNIDPKIK